jgi:hypothetical protein
MRLPPQPNAPSQNAPFFPNQAQGAASSEKNRRLEMLIVLQPDPVFGTDIACCEN